MKNLTEEERYMTEYIFNKTVFQVYLECDLRVALIHGKEITNKTKDIPQFLRNNLLSFNDVIY